MELYSYEGKNPERLPHRIRLDNGETRTSLNELSKEELNALGFFGPIDSPSLTFDENTQKLQWNETEYIIVDLTEEESHEIKVKQIANTDYVAFWDELIKTKFYKKIRFLSTNSLQINTICTEIASLFNDAKSKFGNANQIQKYINIIFLSLEFSDDEVKELEEVLEQNKLDLIYHIPSQEYLSSKVYDFESNTILNTCPYPSWSIVDGEWKAPIERPDLINVYEWDEKNQQWVFLESPVQ